MIVKSKVLERCEYSYYDGPYIVCCNDGVDEWLCTTDQLEREKEPTHIRLVMSDEPYPGLVEARTIQDFGGVVEEMYKQLDIVSGTVWWGVEIV